jgi:hypothetical protein
MLTVAATRVDGSGVLADHARSHAANKASAVATPDRAGHRSGVTGDRRPSSPLRQRQFAPITFINLIEIAIERLDLDRTRPPRSTTRDVHFLGQRCRGMRPYKCVCHSSMGIRMVRKSLDARRHAFVCGIHLWQLSGFPMK